MSVEIRAYLAERGLLSQTTHEQRVEIDKRIEDETGKFCDEGIHDLDEESLIEIVDSVMQNRETNKEKIKKKKKLVLAC